MPGEASQDGPEQKENKPRSDENVVTPKSREKSTFVQDGLGGARVVRRTLGNCRLCAWNLGAWRGCRRPDT